MKNLLIVMLFLASVGAMADGREVAEQRCSECHVMDGKGGSKQAAPPMYAVWHHYRQAYPEQEKFVAAIAEWLRLPEVEKSKMRGAISKFGLMPQQEISVEESQQVAQYLATRSFEIPNWYLDLYSKKYGSPKDQ